MDKPQSPSDLDLPNAIKIIKDLEAQLDEIHAVSKEYENEMEKVIEKLHNDLVHCKKMKDENKIKLTNLEIRVDELENENSFLSNKLLNLNTQNDKLVEQNILLEHELIDIKHYLEEIEGQKSLNGNVISKGHAPLQERESRDNKTPMKVSTNGKSLTIASSLGKNNNNNNNNNKALNELYDRTRGQVPVTGISQSTVLTTTSTAPIRKS